MARQIENGSFRHVSITVSDLDAARAFYCGVLGMEEVYRPDLGVPGAWLSVGGELQLHILVNKELRRPAAERNGFTVCYPHFALWSEDVPKKARALRRKGLTVHDNAPPGANFSQVFIKDPDGNMIEYIGPGPKRRTRSAARTA
jgi:catechol 2,3-dioxygenase-like lactoylglutathione lyase family enzyme